MAAVTPVRARTGPLSRLRRSSPASCPAPGWSPYPGRARQGATGGAGRRGPAASTPRPGPSAAPGRGGPPSPGRGNQPGRHTEMGHRCGDPEFHGCGGRSAASAERTSAIRCRRSSGESSRVLIGRHGAGRGGSGGRETHGEIRPELGQLPGVRRLTLRRLGGRSSARAGPGASSRSASGAKISAIAAHSSSCAPTEYSRN